GVQPARRMGAPEQAPAGLMFNAPTTSARDTFHIVLLQVPDPPNEAEVEPVEGVAAPAKAKPRALIYAAYGGARVMEEFELRGGTAGKGWNKIIAIHESIKAFTDEQKGTLPPDSD